MYENRLPLVFVVNEFGATRWNPGVAQYMEDQMRVFEAHGLNFALWEWPSSWEPFISTNNAFNFLFGPDPDNNTYVQNSDLIAVIREFWGHNTIKP